MGIHGLSAVSAPSSIGMGGFVPNAMVGFCFNYYPARYFSINLGIKHFSKQVFCQEKNIRILIIGIG